MRRLAVLFLFASFTACAPAPDDPELERLAAESARTSDVDTLRNAIAALRAATRWQDRVAIAKKFMNDTAYSGGFPIVDGGRLVFVHFDERGEGSFSVAGDFNGWDAAALRLNQPVAGFPFYYRVVMAEGNLAGLRYKLVRGGQTWFADPAARSFDWDSYGEISYIAPPADRSHIERWPGFGVGSRLTPRDIFVYVPAAEGPLPVLYAHDGQNLWPRGWQAKQAADQAIDAGLRPFLLVAIPNTPARMSEYTHVEDDIGIVTGGRGGIYVDFLADALKPFIDTRYPTDPAREQTGILGSSLGGLISLYAVWRRPDVFAHGASFSGTVGWGSIGRAEETVVDLYAASAPADVTLYVDSGGGPGDGCVDTDGDGLHDDGDGSDNYCENLDFLDVVHDLDIPVVEVWDEGAPHNEAAWAERLPGALWLWFPGPAE